MKAEHKSGVRHSATEMAHHAPSNASKGPAKPATTKAAHASKASDKGAGAPKADSTKKKKKKTSTDHDYIRPDDVLMVSSDNPIDQPLELQWTQRAPSNRPHPANLNDSVEDDSMSGEIERLLYDTASQFEQWDSSIYMYTQRQLETARRFLEQIRRDLATEHSSSQMSPEEATQQAQLHTDEKALARQVKSLEQRLHFLEKRMHAFGDADTPRAASAQMNGAEAPHGETSEHASDEQLKIHATATFHRHFGTPVEKVEALELEGVWRGIFKFPHLLQKPEVQQYWRDKDKRVLVRTRKEHKASWNELLFDLVFVIVLSYLAGGLETDFSGRALMEYFVLFFAVWRIWENANVYVNRFHPRDAFHKLYFILEMACVMGIAINTFHGVIICYLVARAITEGLMLFSAIFDPKVRARAYADGALFAVSAIPWIVSAFLENNAETIGAREHPDYLHLALWGGGLFIEVIGFVFVRNIPALSLPVNIEHLVERYGLFTMIVLGEQVAVLLFYAEEAATETYGCACLGGILVFDIFICYFEVEAARQKKHAIYRGSTKYKLWYWGHLIFHGAVIAAAAGVRALIHSTSHSSNAHSGIVSNISVASLPYARYLFGESIAIAYFMLTLFGFLNRPDDSVLVHKNIRLSLRLMTALVALIFPFVATYTTHVQSAVQQLAIIVGAATLSGIVEVIGGVPVIDPSVLTQRQVLHMKVDARKHHKASRSSVVDPSSMVSVVSGTSSEESLIHPTRTVSLPTPRKESAALLSSAPATFEDRNRPGSLATLTIDTPGPADTAHLLSKESGSGKPLSPISGSAPVAPGAAPVSFNSNHVAAQ